MNATEELTWRTEFAWVFAAAFLTAGTAAIALLHNSLFYFQDDLQIYFMPMFGEIARLLKSGEFPFLTDRIWYGGAIAGEYQFAVFNPISLATYLLIDEVGQLHHAASLFVLIHVAILAGGLQMLARKLGADPLASLLAALIGGTSSWLIYWGASTWVTALVGSTWFVWAVWGLLNAYGDRRWVIPAALLTYLVLVSGWSYGAIALAAGLAVAVPMLLYKERQFAACFRVALASGSAMLLAAPALLPVVAFLSESVRIADEVPLFQASFDGLVLALGFPFFPDTWRIWDSSYQLLVSPPMYYLSWFVPLVLVNALARRSMFAAATIKTILWAVAILFAILSMLPALWLFKYAFRFLPYYHFALALLVALMVTEQRQSDNGGTWRFWPTSIVLVVSFLIAVANAPEIWATQVKMVFLIAVAAGIIMWFQRRRVSSWPILLVVSHALAFAALTSTAPSNILVSSWGTPLGRTVPDLQAAKAARTFALYPPMGQTENSFGGTERVPGDYWVTVAPGNTALYRNTQTINGYTPTLQRGFIENFCLGLRGTTCSDGPSMIFAVDPQSNMSYLDLMGVNRVVAIRGSGSNSFAAHAGNDWVVSDRSEVADIFERTAPRPRVGNISLWPDGMQIQSSGSTTRSESYDISGRHTGGRVILARAWYPGFRARLDGREIPLEPIARMMPSVVLPADAHGRLVIDYWPAGLTAGLYTALAGVLMLMTFTLVSLFVRRPRV